MDFLNDRRIAVALVAAILVSIGLTVLVFTGVIGGTRFGAQAPQSVGAAFELADFRDLEGWRLDDAAQTLPVLLRSCERFAALADDAPANPREALGPGAPPGATLAGTVKDWRAPCAEALRIEAQTYADGNAKTSAARALYEFHFRPVRIYERRAAATAGPGEAPTLTPDGRFTAYFEPFYAASAVRTAEFSAPVYARPSDLVMVDLGLFRPELAGQRIAGRVVDGALDPYPDHAAINAGALAGRARIIAFMRPSDLLFLQIQGSGRLDLAGRRIRVGYDGANGRPYTAIGKTLLDQGELELKNISMQTIREWLDNAASADARAVRESNASFVFFRVVDDEYDASLGPLGAAGAPLTPGRSLAVDPRYTPFGAPVWVDIPGDAKEGETPFRRLLIAQDQGGAVKGAVRGDIFVGSGPQAGQVAGAFNEIGEMYVLIPTPLAERLPRRKAS